MATEVAPLIVSDPARFSVIVSVAEQFPLSSTTKRRVPVGNDAADGSATARAAVIDV